MIKDLQNLIFLYLEISEFHELEIAYKLHVPFYCRRVNNIDLSDCCACGCLEAVKYLATANYPEIAMSVACTHGHTNIVKYLQSLRDVCTGNMLHIAVHFGHLEALKCLCSLDKKRINYALFSASQYDRLEIFEYFASIGKLKVTSSMILEAEWKGHTHIVNFLKLHC